MPSFPRSGLALAALLAVHAAAPASVDQVVTFSAAAAPGKSGAQIQGYLSKPKGVGPFPAVVLLHSCLGLPSNRSAIETALNAEGYVALFVDDFSTRGLKETCSVDFPEGPGDAFGALAYVGGLSFVDRARLAAVGFSQGADTALKIASSGASGFAIPAGLKFRAAAAFYPPCANIMNERLEIPTLILVGENDGVTPAADCKELARNNLGPARLVVYPDAAHCFDDPAFRGGKKVLGMMLRYDPAAAKSSRQDLGAFLAEQLGR